MYNIRGQFRQHFTSSFYTSGFMLIFLVNSTDQGWPDFFDRGPNLKNIFHLGPHFSRPHFSKCVTNSAKHEKNGTFDGKKYVEFLTKCV